MKRSLRLIAAGVVLGGAAALVPSAASATTTEPYYCSNSYYPVPFSDGAYDRAITLPNGALIGYVKNEKSTSCNGWFDRFALTNTAYTVDVSVWHPNESSVDLWSGPWTSWQNTPAIDLRHGVQNCSGAQIYYRNGGWVKWQFFGCWTG